MPSAPLHIHGLLEGEIRDWLAARGHPPWRSRQILDWIYGERRAAGWSGMGNLPLPLREELAGAFSIEPLRFAAERRSPTGSGEDTRKHLWRLDDGAHIESVLIPASAPRQGRASERRTLCVSTQVGCAFGCVFCASGLDGFRRNLEAHEIVGQVLAAQERAEGPSLSARRIDNLVFMGMGEPLANLRNLMRALEILNAEWGAGIGARRITISTSGLVPGIRALAEQPRPYRLAISLHGPTDEVRERIMPVNRAWPLAELEEACAAFVRRGGRRITLEYILIEDINDSLELVRPLARLARTLRARVNLIPYNRVEGLDWRRPPLERQKSFLQALQESGAGATLRQEKGHDIDAACGQLRLLAEKGRSPDHANQPPLPLPG